MCVYGYCVLNFANGLTNWIVMVILNFLVWLMHLSISCVFLEQILRSKHGFLYLGSIDPLMPNDKLGSQRITIKLLTQWELESKLLKATKNGLILISGTLPKVQWRGHKKPLHYYMYIAQENEYYILMFANLHLHLQIITVLTHANGRKNYKRTWVLDPKVKASKQPYLHDLEAEGLEM
ncbi:hypothetical protein ACJX0J_016092, partial [Zea mays]